MKNSERRLLLKGYASIEPTRNAMEAEAIAFREAIMQIVRWGYEGVTFCENAKNIYHTLGLYSPRNRVEGWKHHEW